MSAKSLNRIFWATEYWYNVGECKLGQKLQIHFSGKTSQSLKLFQKIINFLKFAIKWFKVCQKPKSNLLNCWILIQVSKCKIWSLNAKPFCLQNETDAGALQKNSPCVVFFYKFILKSAKSIIIWLNICTSLYNAKFAWLIQGRQSLILCKKFI